ncbi:nucleoside phosphorylase [Tanacetum coccineum]
MIMKMKILGGLAQLAIKGNLREGAALAYVCSLMRVPAIFIKAVSNFVDGEKSIPEEFAENLKPTVVALRDVVVPQVVEFINGKSLYEL